MRRVNGWLTVFWIALICVSIIPGWINSVCTRRPSRCGRWSPVTGPRGTRPGRGEARRGWRRRHL